MQEIWKDIPGYENLYQVSNLGRVKSLCIIHNKKVDTSKTLIRKLSYNILGYQFIGLRKNGSRKQFYVHRLVATLFIPNPDNKPQVNHIDGNKSNNIVSNLEWVTISENQRHAVRIGLKKGRKGSVNPCSKPILQYTISGEFIKKWESIASAAKSYNVSRESIKHCLVGESHQSCGYVWKFETTDSNPA